MTTSRKIKRATSGLSRGFSTISLDGSGQLTKRRTQVPVRVTRLDWSQADKAMTKATKEAVISVLSSHRT